MVRTFKSASFSRVFCFGVLVVLLIGREVSWAQPQGDTEHAWRSTDPVVRAANRGVALMERYQYAEAVKAFEEGARLAPKSIEVRVNLAIALYNRNAKGDLERADELLDAVLHEDPDNVRALYLRGIMHQYRGRDEEAVPCFQRVLKLEPHDASAWYLLARSKSHLDQPWRAELERAIQENPALVSAYYDLMRVTRQEGNQEQARLYQEKFVKLRQSPLADTVVMPNYNQMGPLAVVRPLSTLPKRGVVSGELAAGTVKTLWKASESISLQSIEAGDQPAAIRRLRAGAGRLAMADVNGDGRLDMVTTAKVSRSWGCTLLLAGHPDGSFVDITVSSGLANVCGALAYAFGDYDNDDNVDLFVSRFGPNCLFRGRGDGTFEDVTERTKTAGANVVSASAVFLDADHDADLDIYVCNLWSVATGHDSSPVPNQLLNNNADGTFTDIAASAGVACQSEPSITLAPADIDGDRDTDLVVFNQGPARVFFNDRLGKYHEEQITTEPIRGDFGGVLQDFNGDGQVDLLVTPGLETPGRLYLADGTGTLVPSSQFDGCIEALATWGRHGQVRIVDVDLDGDLDVGVFGQGGHVILNDGWGRFVSRMGVWPRPASDTAIARELIDLTGDGVPDCLRVCTGGNGRIELVETKLTPPANWLAVSPTGHRGADKRTRSPASGFGTRMELRCGMHSQMVIYTGLNGGLTQSHRPVIFGLDGVTKADYLAFRWPDGVTQYESDLAAGTHHRISEMERRVSSCPVLFAWNGDRFEFVSDFAGVGGLGYFAAPGQYASPQALEHVKIEPEQLASRNGFYELRICEPMEEVGYVDRLALLAVDHPKRFRVYPDERLAISGPPPSHRLLCPSKPIFPVRGTAPDRTDCTRQLTVVDRKYAYQPKLDRRFYGFCKPHTLVVDFADRLADLQAGRQVYLFLNGWIEYPYSQTTFAAAQAGVNWQPMKVERETADGRWETIIPDAGAPGGMGRMITIDLTGKICQANCKLRISTNLEIYYDQLFIASDRGTEGFVIRRVPMAGASLRRLGFPLEYSPDGRHPYVYTYDIIQPTSSFKILKGAYTRYGSVETLLAEFDDRYVILGTGDEIAVRFDARALPPPGEGHIRSFILVSHAYCKDMDLYTAAPDTVKPLPFREMSAYPYPANEHYPNEDEFRYYHQRFNTRSME